MTAWMKCVVVPPPTLASLWGRGLSIAGLRELWFILIIPIPSSWWQGGSERSYCRLYSVTKLRGHRHSSRRMGGGGTKMTPPRRLGKGRAGSSEEGRSHLEGLHVIYRGVNFCNAPWLIRTYDVARGRRCQPLAVRTPKSPSAAPLPRCKMLASGVLNSYALDIY